MQRSPEEHLAERKMPVSLSHGKKNLLLENVLSKKTRKNQEEERQTLKRVMQHQPKKNLLHASAPWKELPTKTVVKEDHASLLQTASRVLLKDSSNAKMSQLRPK